MNIVILVLFIGGIYQGTNCDDGGLCFKTFNECEKFSARINLQNQPGVMAMCERLGD